VVGVVGRRAAALLAVVVLSGTVLAGCGGSTAGTGTGTSAGRSSAVPSTEAPGEDPAVGPAAPGADPRAPGQERALPLYYVTDTPAGPRLAREFRRLPVGPEPAAAGTAAVTALFAAPAGSVPGHVSHWPPGSALAGPVTHDGGVVTVDLDPRAAAAAPAEPLLAVQQLVHTVTGALGTTDPVRLLVAGRVVPRLWNDGVATVAPVARADPLGVRVLVGIDDPAEGAVVGSPVRVRGEAAVFEANLLWEVRRDGAVVRSGATSTAEGQRFAPYEFVVRLPPGEYEVRVAEDDPSDGEGRPPMTDSRRITVTG
jgi:predicted small secreted protein